MERFVMTRSMLTRSMICLPALLALALSPPAAAQTPAAQTPEAQGLAIAESVDRANGGFGGEKATVEMALINAQGERVVRKLTIRTLEMKGDGDRSLLTFEWPADVKGTRLLTWAHLKDDDDQWLYLPAMRRVKRISARNKSGAFMGSEFAFEDLGGQEPAKYKWRLDREEVVDGRPAWVLTRVPTDKGSGYSKQVVWMDREWQQPVRIDYYDRKGELLKTMKATAFAQHQKWWRPAALEMVNHQTRKKSQLAWTSRTMGEDFDAEDFDREALED
jgi:hypothetical protein